MIEQFIETYRYWIETYGYWVVLGGALIEGEHIILAMGVLASQGFLKLPYVIILAFIGTLISDQVLFQIGRFYGKKLILRFPSLEPKAEKVYYHLRKHANLFIMSNRFMYGLRIAGPILIGASGVAVRKFSILNVFAALLWAIVVSSVGYLIAEPVLIFLNFMTKNVKYFFLAVLILGTLYILYKRLTEKNNGA